MTISLFFSHSWKRENKILKLEIHLAFFKYYCLVCLKDFYKWFTFNNKKSKLYNFAYDNTIASSEDTVKDMIEELEQKVKQL